MLSFFTLRVFFFLTFLYTQPLIQIAISFFFFFVPANVAGNYNNLIFFKLICSFVRSVTMDKWKDIELEKMKAGGNSKFREFLESQDDYDPCWTMQEKYNSKAAALFRDQVSSEVCVLIPCYLKTSKYFVCTWSLKVAGKSSYVCGI